MNILIVDDQPISRKLLHATLEAEGYTVAKAADGVEALQLLESQGADAVISDILMPRMDGYRLCSEVRRRKEFKHLPFIHYTATYISPSDEKLSSDLGADVFLRKPAPAEEIIDALRRVTSKEHKVRATPATPAAPESDVMKEYSERLVAKLEHKNLELERLHRQHELILNSAGEGIYGLDLEGKIGFTNPKSAQMLGWNAGELLGKSCHAMIHHTKNDGSKYPPESCPIYASMRDGGTRRVTNDAFWRKDGSSFRVDYVSAPIKDEQGRIAGSIVTFKDITEQVAAEGRQQLQAEQYRLLFETNPSPMWVFDTKSLQILAVNQAAIAQYGYSRDEFLKLSLKDLRPPGDVPDLIRGRALSSPQPMSHFSGQFRHKRKDGSLLLVEIYSGPVVWDGVGARMVTAIDVTERKEAGERMQAILDSALDCVITMDHQGKVVEFNPAAEKTFGYKRAEAIGQLLADLIVPPALRGRHQRGLTHYLSTGEAPALGKRIELTGMRSDHSEFPLELAITRIGAQEPPMFTGFIRDITERKQAEHRLREQAKLLDLAEDAIIVRDMEDRVEFWNHGAEKLYGWTAAEVQGKKASYFLYENQPAATAAARAAVIENGKWTGECKHARTDGGTVMVRSRWTLVRHH